MSFFLSKTFSGVSKFCDHWMGSKSSKTCKKCRLKNVLNVDCSFARSNGVECPGIFRLKNVLFEKLSAESEILVFSLKDGSGFNYKMGIKGLSTNKQSFQRAWYQCFISDFVLRFLFFSVLSSTLLANVYYIHADNSDQRTDKLAYVPQPLKRYADKDTFKLRIKLSIYTLVTVPSIISLGVPVSYWYILVLYRGRRRPDSVSRYLTYLR